jgi:hypothetical protein
VRVFFGGPFIHESSSPPSILINTSVAIFYVTCIFAVTVPYTDKGNCEECTTELQ